MTDAEIIKALECCKEQEGCDNCPMYDGTEDCCPLNNAMVLNLINRQKAQIEKLEKVEHFATKTIDRLQADIKEFNDKFNSLVASNVYLINRVDKTKTEAINEFAERLKNEIISDTAYGCDVNQKSGYYDYTIKIGDIPEYIDNLVKEMEGKEDA